MWWPAAGEAAFEGRWVAFPGVWLLVAGVGVGGFLWQRGRGDAATGMRHRRLLALAGWLTLWVALDWPVGALAAGHLLTVRATQYLVLTFVSVPSFLLGLRATRATAPSPASRTAGALSHPAVALPLFAITLALTHFPRVVDAVTPHAPGVLAVDLAWLAAATVFWWRIVGPEPDARRLPYLGAMVYLVVPFLLTKAPGLVFAFRDDPLYASFAMSPPTFGLGHGVDQQIAGFLLWFVGSVMVVTALGVLFFRWQAEDRRMGTSDSLALPVDPRALALLFAAPGAWSTLEAVVAGLAEALPGGTHGAELAFAYRERPGEDTVTQVILELRIALDAERERALERRIDRLVSESLGRLPPAERVAVTSRFAFRVVTYGTRVS